MIRQRIVWLYQTSPAWKSLCLALLVLSFNPPGLCVSSAATFGSHPLFMLSLLQQSTGLGIAGQEITPGKSLEGEISGEQRQSYSLNLAARQYARLTFQQDGIDVVVRLFNLDNKPLLEIDSESRIPGQEILELVAQAPGAYRIEVQPKYKFAPPGRYQVRIAELRAATERDNSLDEARRLHFQATTSYRNSRYEDAIHSEQQSLNKRQELLGPEHPEVAASLFGLGLYYRNSGQIPEAEDSYLRALAIREKALGPEDPGVSLILHNLGYLYYYDLHDYARAKSMYERSLAIKEKALGREHPVVASTLGNLGLLQWKQHNYARAEAYYRQALEIFRKTEGQENESYATYTHDLGIIYKESGDYVNGEACYREALGIWEKVLGKNHPMVALGLESLGILYRDKGDYERASQFLQRAIEIEVTKRGANHPDVANTLVILARLKEAQGDTAHAVDYQWRAAEIEEKNIARNLWMGSERQKLAYFSSMTKEADRRISLHVRSAPDDPRARDLALTMVLQRKGRVLDALADTSAALRRGLNPQDLTLLDNLNDTTASLARLVLQGPAGHSPAEHENAIKSLEEQRDELQEELSQRTAGFYQPSPPTTIEAVRHLVPDDAALIEFAVYHPSDPKASVEHDQPSETRYVAYVIRNRGAVEWRELGSAREINSAVDAFRQALADPQKTGVRRLARSLEEKVLQPLRASLGQTKRLLISPDGELNLIPFAALVDEHGHYLLERYSFTYLTSGRDLLRLQVRRESKDTPVVIADPAYGPPALTPVISDARFGDPSSGNSMRVDYSQVFFTPLPGVTEEVRALKAILPQARFFTRENATKEVVKRLRGPAILHVATHGFFLQDEPPSATDDRIRTQGKDASRLSKWRVHVENPLLRSGLALAGANRGDKGNTDGILTALEVTGLDLWGTKLVVLSACDTGIGEIRNGEGVYGLRRALVLAGAESQLMSLWPVSDLSTRDLIVSYYRALMQGDGRGEALRQVQLRMLKDHRRSHPYYWAGFIQVGEWTGLDGKR